MRVLASALKILRFQGHFLKRKRNNFYFVPAMLGMGWFNPELQEDSDPILFLCFEVKSTHQSMEQT